MAIITTPDPVKTVKFSVERRRIAVGADRRIFSSPSVPNRLKVRRRNFFGLILPFMVLAGQSEAATYTVTNLNDSGTGSLRAAMLSANASKGSTVAFGIGGTITLTEPLPPITTQMTIDGTTAPDFNEIPEVSVNFGYGPGLIVAAGGDSTTIKSLSLVRAVNAAVTLQALKVTIQGDGSGLQQLHFSFDRWFGHQHHPEFSDPS